MEVFYPKYYDTFACIANLCPDSCCKDWSVDVDPKSAAVYRKLPGALGQRLRKVLQDTPNGTIMTIQSGRCPMWQEDGLCHIQAQLGHEALCDVCRNFPRLRHDYGSFVELGLELSCPEAARLILADQGEDFLVQYTPGKSNPDYDPETMAVLQRSRKEFLCFLKNSALPFAQVLTTFLRYAYNVQEELDGGISAVLPAEFLAVPASTDFTPLQNFFLSLEILTPQWKARLNTSAVIPQWTPYHRALLRYFIQRYWLQAVSDYDIVCRAKLIVAACLLIGCLGNNLIETAQLFSKEIENCPDNIATILDSAYTNPALTDLYLLSLLSNP